MLESTRWTIAKRDLSSLSREKTIVLAIAIQLFIAAFSSFLVVGLTSLYNPGSVDDADIVIEVAVTGDASDRLLEAAGNRDGVRMSAFDDRADAMGVFESGRVDAVLTAETVPGEQGTRVDVSAIVPAESLQTTLTVVQVRELLVEVERTERFVRASHLQVVPLELPEDVQASPYFGFTYTILLPLLLFLPAFISGSVVVDTITEEIERGTLELLRVAPVSLVDIVDGKALGMIALAPLQAGMWILLLRLNGTAIAHVGTLLVLVTAMATVTVVLGVLLGLLTAKRRQAQLLYSMLVILLFVGAALMPEHPATTIALLAVDSATTSSFLHVAGLSALAVSVYALARRRARRMNPEAL